MTRKTAQEIVDGFPKGSHKNRSQHVLEAAQGEGQVQAAYEVLKLLTSDEPPEIVLGNIGSWADATIQAHSG
jgi:hypothetical protein